MALTSYNWKQNHEGRCKNYKTFAQLGGEEGLYFPQLLQSFKMYSHIVLSISIYIWLCEFNI